jgi:hypothetical protein
VVITYADEDWVNLRDGDTVLLSFQRALDCKPPEWPKPNRRQQFHRKLLSSPALARPLDHLALIRASTIAGADTDLRHLRSLQAPAKLPVGDQAGGAQSRSARSPRPQNCVP